MNDDLKKRLAKQIKEFDRDIQDLEKKIVLLKQKKQAVSFLLDEAGAPGLDEAKAAGTRSKRKRKGLHDDIFELLRDQEGGLTQDEIIGKLREQEKAFSGASTVYYAMKRHSELFNRDSNGKWRAIKAE